MELFLLAVGGEVQLNLEDIAFLYFLKCSLKVELKIILIRIFSALLFGLWFFW